MNTSLAPLLFMANLFVVVVVLVVALVWVSARRKERQAFYLSEIVKKIADSPSASGTELLREYERFQNRRVREALTVCGIVGLLAGVGLIVFLHGIGRVPIYRVGFIPLLVGAGMLIYARLLAPPT